MQVQRQCQGEVNHPSSSSSSPLTLPQDSSPVLAWHTPQPQPTPLVLKPLFLSISHTLPPNQCPSVLTLLSSHAAKRIMQVKRCLQWSSRRKASLKTHTPSIKSKKARLFGHYHRVNETLNTIRPLSQGE